MAINFRTLDVFDREFRKLIKKYPSLKKDFSLFQKFLEQEPTGLGIGDIERINGLGEEIVLPIYKVRKFACKSLAQNRSQSGIRIIYAYDATTDTVEFIEFVEIYYK